VEPERAASYTAALAAGKPVKIQMKPTLADGLSVSDGRRECVCPGANSS